MVKRLFADAGSGIILNFSGEITIGEETLPEGVIMLPVKHQTENIVLSPGAKLAGIRFHPAIGYGVLGKHYEKPTLLSPKEDQLYNLYRVYSELRKQRENEKRVASLEGWAEKTLDFIHVIPDSLEKSLELISQREEIGDLTETTRMSQRQIERHFKAWLGMTPKYFQRILRIKNTICHLRQTHNTNLADVAHQFGFSDQAHMTREFRAIARITPGKL